MLRMLPSWPVRSRWRCAEQAAQAALTKRRANGDLWLVL